MTSEILRWEESPGQSCLTFEAGDYRVDLVFTYGAQTTKTWAVFFKGKRIASKRSLDRAKDCCQHHHEEELRAQSKSRESFEKWAASQWLILDMAGDKYDRSETHWAWHAWKKAKEGDA